MNVSEAPAGGDSEDEDYERETATRWRKRPRQRGGGGGSGGARRFGRHARPDGVKVQRRSPHTLRYAYRHPTLALTANLAVTLMLTLDKLPLLFTETSGNKPFLYTSKV